MAGVFRGFGGVGSISGLFRGKPSPTKTDGVAGTVILSGFIVRNEKNADVDSKRYETWSNMLANVAIIGASVRKYLNFGSKPNWISEPADDSDAAKEVAEFVLEVLNDMRTPWFRVVRRMLMYRWWGFSVQEWTMKRRDDGRMGFLDIEARPQHTIYRWGRDDGGNINGMIQLDPQSSQEIPLLRSKVVYIVDDAISDSPEGLGIFRQMTETSARLDRYQQLEKFGFENNLRGIPKLRIPYAQLNAQVSQGKISPAEMAAIIAPLETFAAAHLLSPQAGVSIDSSTYRSTDEAATPSTVPLWDIELMTGGDTGVQAVAAAIDRLQRELARLAGTEDLMIIGSGTGSLALSKDRSSTFALIVDSSLREVSDVVDSDVVVPLLEINGIDLALKPKVKPEQLQFQDVETIARTLDQMATAGAMLMPDDPAINVVRGLMGLPDQPEMDLAAMSLRTGLGAMPGVNPTVPEPAKEGDDPGTATVPDGEGDDS